MTSQQELNYIEVEFINKGSNQRKIQVQDDAGISYTTVVIPKSSSTENISSKPPPPIPSRPPPRLSLQEDNDLFKSEQSGEQRERSGIAVKRLGALKGLRPVPNKQLGKTNLPGSTKEQQSLATEYANEVKKPDLKASKKPILPGTDNYVQESPLEDSKVESDYKIKPTSSKTTKNAKEDHKIIHSAGGKSNETRPVGVRTDVAKLKIEKPSSNVTGSENTYINVVPSKLDVQARHKRFETNSGGLTGEKGKQYDVTVSKEVQQRAKAIPSKLDLQTKYRMFETQSDGSTSGRRKNQPDVKVSPKVLTKQVTVPPLSPQDSFNPSPGATITANRMGKILDPKTDLLPADFRRRAKTAPDAYSKKNSSPNYKIESQSSSNPPYMNVAIEGKQNLPSYENFCPDIQNKTITSKPKILLKKTVLPPPSEKHAMGPWYHGYVDQPTAESMLKRKGIERCYFVRQALKESSDELCLSLFYKGETHHLSINYNEKMHLYSIGNNIKKFQNIEELLNYYTKKSIPNQESKDMKLGIPL